MQRDTMSFFLASLMLLVIALAWFFLKVPEKGSELGFIKKARISPSFFPNLRFRI